MNFHKDILEINPESETERIYSFIREQTIAMNQIRSAQNMLKNMQRN